MKTRDSIRRWSLTLGAVVLGVIAVATATSAEPAKPRASRTVAPAARPLSEAERRLAAELQEAQKRFDTGGARVMAATPGGRRRVPEAIARHFGVAEKSVVELRAKRMTYGEVSVALSLSRQWTARDRTLTARQSLDRIVALRKTHEWVAVARQLNLRLEDVIGDLKTAEKQLAKLDPVTAARVERQEPKGTRLPR